MSDTPPRDLKSLREWRAARYEQSKKEEFDRAIDQMVNRPVSPKKKVAPKLKKRSKEPGQFPRIGERSKKRGPGNREAGEGYTE